MKGSPAYTLIELLIVVALVGILSVSGYWAFTTARENQLISAAAEQVADTMRRASIYSQNARNEQTWGIRSDDQQTYVIVSRTDNGEEFTDQAARLPQSLQFTTPFLFWFSKGKGGVAQDTQIQVSSPRQRIATISLQTNGAITVTVP